MTVINASAISSSYALSLARNKILLSSKALSEPHALTLAQLNKPVKVVGIDVYPGRIRIHFDSPMKSDAALVDPSNYSLLAKLVTPGGGTPPEPPPIVDLWQTFSLYQPSYNSSIFTQDAYDPAFKAAHPGGHVRVGKQDYQYYFYGQFLPSQPFFEYAQLLNGDHHPFPHEKFSAGEPIYANGDLPFDLNHNTGYTIGWSAGVTRIDPGTGTALQDDPNVPASANFRPYRRGIGVGDDIYEGTIYTPPPAGMYGNGYYTLPRPLEEDIPTDSYLRYYTPRPDYENPVPGGLPYKAAELFYSQIVPERVIYPRWVDIILDTEMTTDGEYQCTIATPDGPCSTQGDPIENESADFSGEGVAPNVQAVKAIATTIVDVIFTERMKNNDAIKDPNNYEFDKGLVVLGVMGVNGDTVRLITSAQTPGELYTLTVAPST